MIVDPFGLGPVLYGFKPVEINFSGVDPDAFAMIVGTDLDIHEACWINQFCRAPLHPGPCKGWKKKLGTEAPGILKAIEAARKEALAKKRAKTAEAKSAAEKGLTERQLASPLHAKKAKIKAANQILGNDEAKAGKKADRVILNKAEIKKFSKIKAAQITQLRDEVYGIDDESKTAKFAAYIEGRIAEALAEDNKTGKDDEYQSLMSSLSGGMSAAFADKLCKEKDGDCDGELYEGLAEAAEPAVLQALKTGNKDAMNEVAADFKAGKIKAKEAEPEPPVAPPKKAAAKKAAAALTGNAAKAEKGKDYALGLMAAAKGNKTLGTKAAQQSFADKLEKALDEGDSKGIIPQGAQHIATVVTSKIFNPKLSEPAWMMKTAEKNSLSAHLAAEAVKAIKGEDGPFPYSDLAKEMLQQQKTKDFNGFAGNKAKLAEMLTDGADLHKPKAEKLAGYVTEIADTLKPGMNAASKKDVLASQIAADLAAGNADKIKNQLYKAVPKLVAEAKPDGAYDGFEQDMADELKAEMDALLVDPDAKAPNLHAALVAIKSKGAIPPVATPSGAAKATPTSPATDDAADAATAVNAPTVKVVSDVVKDAYHDHAKAILGGKYDTQPEVKKSLIDTILPVIGDDLDPEDKAKLEAQAGNGSGTKPSAPASPAVQKASDVANGVVSMTDTKKLPVYQALTADEFGQLDPNTQKLILANLDAMAKKFLDPKKKQQVQQIKDKLTAGGGGGSGAGGSAGAGVAPTLMEHQQVAKGLNALSAYAKGGPDKHTPADQQAIQKMLENTADPLGKPDDFTINNALGGIAAAHLGTQLKKLGLNGLDLGANLGPLLTDVQADYKDALDKGWPSPPPGTTADDFISAVNSIKHQSNTMAASNGWSPDDPMVVEWNKAALQAELEEALSSPTPAPAKPSGSGGGTTAPNPAAASVNLTVGTGTEIDDIPMATQNAIVDDLKGFSEGKYLSDDKKTTYGNLLALAAVHGTKEKPLSLLQTLKSVDNAFSKKQGWTNTNNWEKAFVEWLGTPEGAKFAADNPDPNANLVKKLKGVYDGITTDLNELAEKVKLLPGPGAFDQDKTSSDFQVQSVAQGFELKGEMLADQGGKYTAAQLSGIKVYTSNQYSAMNSWLRGLTSYISDDHRKAIKNTQDAMRPLPKDILLHRGTGWKALPEGFRSPAGAKKLIGKTVMDEAFMSTSVGGSAAYGGQMLLMEIEAPKGTMAAFVEGKAGDKVSTYQGEREMLLAAGQQYQVVSVTENGNQTIVRVRIVTPNA